MSIAKLSLTSRELTDLIITSRFEYWAESEGSGLNGTKLRKNLEAVKVTENLIELMV